MSNYILLETGDKIEIEDDTGYLELDWALRIHRMTKACRQLRETQAAYTGLETKAEYQV